MRESSNNGIIGYNAWNGENSRVALVLTSQLGEYDPASVDGFESLKRRNIDILFGVRTSHYQRNNIIQLELLTDVTGRGQGLVATWRLGDSVKYETGSPMLWLDSVIIRKKHSTTTLE